MRTLDHARQRAREMRALIGSETDELLARLSAFIEQEYRIELIPVPAAVIDEGRAEVSPSERALNYDERLERKPGALLWVLAHELGHLTMHQRLTKPWAEPDPLLGSAYLNDGTTALARYSRKAREEAEANAFASEFISPVTDVFAEWRDMPGATSHSIAARRGVPEKIVRAQLAEALHHLLLNPEQIAKTLAETNSDPGAAERKTDSDSTADEDSVSPGAPPDSTHRKPVAADERQLAAATFTGAPALVTAGPGTGKTATLVRRIEYLLNEQKALPQQFLVLTFSNDAAHELRERIAAKFGLGTAGAMEIATFHGFGLSFLHHHALELSPDVTILDEIGQEELLTGLPGSLRCPNIINLRDLEDSVKRLARHINFLKDRVLHTEQGDQPITPELFAAELSRWQPDQEDEISRRQKALELCQVFAAYEKAKAARPAVDFADLIALPIRVLAARPQLVLKAREKYRWVLVDEYQDVSRTVALLLRQLCGPENPPWVVGDMRQAIYRFRGAAPENVLHFARDFPGAQIFELETNYRSCAEVVQAANQLATLMEATQQNSSPVDSSAVDNQQTDKVQTADSGLKLIERWHAGTSLTRLSDPAVALARANADAAEYDGIAAQVRAWIDAGIAAQDIAVLARRNADVRNIVLALGARGIKATTSGLITPEGAAGDLAAVVTCLDNQVASLPRIVYSLGRARFDNQTLNKTIARMTGGTHRQSLSDQQEDRDDCRPSLPTDNDNLSDSSSPGSSDGLLQAEIERLRLTLQDEYHSGDAFDLMCLFLFNGSDYLRRALDRQEQAARDLTLSEIVTSLSRAAGYRYTHADLSPIQSRLSFARWFRDNLSSGKPVIKAPPSATDAVRVMTCHASKGLEFPCVIVAGQTLSVVRDEMWVPPSLQRDEADESAQADALLFVGVTRARRALVVSCAETSSGSERARARTLTPLLERWQQRFAVPVISWPKLIAEKEQLEISPLWGGALKGRLTSGALDDSNCAIRTYLENFVSIRFPEPAPSLYPGFFVSLRLALQGVIERAHETGQQVLTEAAVSIFTESFRVADFGTHLHYSLYQEAGINYLTRFSRVYAPHPRAVEFLDPAALIATEDSRMLPLRFDLLALYRDADGDAHAITFRPESLAKNAAKNHPDELLWSGLKTAHRLAFLLLRNRLPGLQPQVFSAADGVLYKLRWSARASGMTTEHERINERWHALSRGRFATKLNERACDRCPARIACPHWLQAI